MKTKDIPGFEGLYQVTDEGDIISLNYKGTKKPGKLQHSVGKCGIHTVVLARDGVNARRSVANLVAQAFVRNENPSIYKWVTYIDGNHDNLYADNLRWTYITETNQTPEAKAKRVATRKKNGPSEKLTEAGKRAALSHRRKVCAYDDDGDLVATFRSIADARIMLNTASIPQALKESCRCCGYYWKYAAEVKS